MKKIIELQLKTYYDYIYKRSLYLKQNKSIYIYIYVTDIIIIIIFLNLIHHLY